MASVRFWYDSREYGVSFQADPSSVISVADNTRDVLLDMSTFSDYLAYTIKRACKNKTIAYEILSQM